MRRQELQEILACFEDERMQFPYYRDRYALMLLAWYASTGISVQHLKRSKWAGLLRKPLVKGLLAQQGDGSVDAWDFEGVWPSAYEVYSLTLGAWEKGQQTTCGDTNLVLQMNFSNKHNRLYKDVRAGLDAMLRYTSHPISATRDTIAWMRMDVRFETDEVLIEEVQSDWMRSLKCLVQQARRLDSAARLNPWCGGGVLAKDILQYGEATLALHDRIWSEAMLAAGLWFIREKLGVSTVYYHTFEGGSVAKGIRYCHPPRSLYTRLPTQFCFEETSAGPSFLYKAVKNRKRARRLKGVRWFRLDLDEEASSSVTR